MRFAQEVASRIYRHGLRPHRRACAVELSNTASVAELTVNCAFEPTY